MLFPIILLFYTLAVCSHAKVYFEEEFKEGENSLSQWLHAYMHTDVCALADGGTRPPIKLKIPWTSLLESDINQSQNNQETFKDNPPHEKLQTTSTSITPIGTQFAVLPSARPLFQITLKSSPIQTRETIHRSCVLPWLKSYKNDERVKIDRISYYVGSLKINFKDHHFYEDFCEFFTKNGNPEGISFIQSTASTTFIVSGVSLELSDEDRKCFEEKFDCKLLFFLKSKRSGKFIPRAVVRGTIHNMQKLVLSRHSFYGLEIKFYSNAISDMDNYVFPRCSGCQQWGYWVSQCSSKIIQCCFCADLHPSNVCPRKAKKCCNCDSFAHHAFAKTCPKFKEYHNWALSQGLNNELVYDRGFNRNIPDQSNNCSIALPHGHPVNEWVNGRKRPKMSLANSIDNALGVDIEARLGSFYKNIMDMINKRFSTLVEGLERRLSTVIQSAFETMCSSINSAGAMFPDNPASKRKRVGQQNPSNPSEAKSASTAIVLTASPLTVSLLNQRFITLSNITV